MNDNILSKNVRPATCIYSTVFMSAYTVLVSLIDVPNPQIAEAGLMFGWSFTGGTFGLYIHKRTAEKNSS